MGQASSISLPSSLPDLALHVLRTAEDSPSHGSLEPFFDYLIGLDSAGADSQQSLNTEALAKLMTDNEGGKVILKVYNAKSQRIRGESWIEAQPAVILNCSFEYANGRCIAFAFESMVRRSENAFARTITPRVQSRTRA